MTRKEAIDLVEAELNKSFDASEFGPLVVMDEHTWDKSYGWVFFVNTKRFHETKNRRYTVIGVGPVVFVARDRSLHNLPTHLDPEEAVSQFESSNAL